MSDSTRDCEIRRDDLAAYAVDALDAREAEAIREHVAGCPACEEWLRWLGPAVDVLPMTVHQLDPPAELRERLLATVQAEAAAERGEAQGAIRRRGFRIPFLGDLALRPALAGLATILLLAAGVVGYSLRNDAGGETRTFAAKPSDDKSLASGTLEVNGDEGSLRVQNLPPTHKGEVYQAWVVEPTGHQGGEVHPSSVFVVADDGTGTVAIPDGLSNAAQVMVTREPKGGSDVPGESALLAATIR